MAVDREVRLFLPPDPPHGVRGEPRRTARISSRTEAVCSITCWLVKERPLGGFPSCASNGTAERDIAFAMVNDELPGQRRITLAGDKGYVRENS